MQAAHTGRLEFWELRPTICAAFSGATGPGAPGSASAECPWFRAYGWREPARLRIHFFITAQRAGVRSSDGKSRQRRTIAAAIPLFRILHLQKNERHPMR